MDRTAHPFRLPFVLSAALFVLSGRVPCVAGSDDKAAVPVGVAVVDITPDYPVRLSGFGFRRLESEGVTQRIHAKALAFGHDTGGPVVLITAETLCVPDAFTQEVARRLKEKAGVRRERLSITATHTHTAPMLRNTCPTLFGEPIPAEHQAHIDRYTEEFISHLEAVAVAALKDLRPATLEWGQGKVTFAANRRTQGGPVDHDLPVLAVKELNGTLRAVYFSYACHCVTMSHNKISGDWAGKAQEMVETQHPGCVALASVGCGADSNPDHAVSGEAIAAVANQGRQIAEEIHRLLGTPLTSLTVRPQTRYARVDLPFAVPRSREEWQTMAEKTDPAGYYARVNLAKLDGGQKLPASIDYPVQTWLFGGQLAMVFMPGETVVDYSRRLKRELDHSRLWVNGYSNDARCYIPSERILKEGGYEGGGAMIYYDIPNRFAPGLEQKLIDAVRAQVPESFVVPVQKGTEGTQPLAPEPALATLRTAPGLKVELAAAEPEVVDPVAIDWDARGRMWVCEMHDYPSGMDGKGKPGGRIRRLEDTNGDSRYDKAVLFLDGLPFPTGLMVWGRGAYIGAAPDVLYAEDTDGDGRSDKVEKVLTGFPVENYQARVNGFSLGLDGWIYGANGLLATSVRGWEGPPTDIRNRDFRFQPGKPSLEAVTGLTQQGRVRDDWGNWFGCDNSRLLLRFGMSEHYVKRNPFIASGDPVTHLTGRPEGNRLFPVSRLLERFNDPGSANRTTSACGVGFYRDTLLGNDLYGNAFTCEPVHNLVHREVLSGDGVTFTASRAGTEQESEFLASTDNWFRPVQARTGPDGALYIVDMYRFLIEHPRWIPAERLAQIDERAGSEMGRIYRVRPANQPLRAVRDLTRMNAAELAAALDSPCGTERDRVHAELLYRHSVDASDATAGKVLETLAAGAALPAVRVQALCVLDCLGMLTAERVAAALKDADARVRCEAVRLTETRLELWEAKAGDPERAVCVQLALTLGESKQPQAGKVLVRLLLEHPEDTVLRAAVMSSASNHAAVILEAVSASGRHEWIGPLLSTIAGKGDAAETARALAIVLPAENEKAGVSHFERLAAFLDALERQNVKLAAVVKADPRALARFSEVEAEARRLASDGAAEEELRLAALPMLGRGESTGGDVALLCDLASTGTERLRAGARQALHRQPGAAVPQNLLARWTQLLPGIRVEAVSILLTRVEWSLRLLEAVEQKKVSASEISSTARQQLARSRDEPLRALAAKVLPAASATGRDEIIRRRRPALPLAGNAGAGAEVFTLTCSICHLVDGKGSDVGPDLAALRNKDADYWLKNIVDPNAVIEPRFTGYVVKLKDQRSVAGVIRAETATGLTVVMPGGLKESVLRSQVEELEALPQSLMPEGLEQALTDQQLADLIAFLRSASGVKQAPGNRPEIVRAETDGAVVLKADKAEIRGADITFEGEFGNIGMWHGAGDSVTWTAELLRTGPYDVYLDYACAAGSQGNAFRVVAGSEGVTAAVKGTGPDWSAYRQEKAGTVTLTAGKQKVVVRPEGIVRGALFDLRGVGLVPAGGVPSWQGKQGK